MASLSQILGNRDYLKKVHSKKGGRNPQKSEWLFVINSTYKKAKNTTFDPDKLVVGIKSLPHLAYGILHIQNKILGNEMPKVYFCYHY
jgi:hypothetical protein